MKIKNYLTKQEQIIYNNIKSSRTTLTTTDLVDLFPNFTKQRLNEIINSLKNKKYVTQIKKGVYEVVTYKTNNDYFKTALSIYPGYISFLSALRHYNLIDYEPITIFVATTNKSKEISKEKYLYKYININKKYSHYILDQNVFVSSLEKTIFDCFYKPQFSGGYSVITKAIYDCCEKIDWKELIKIYNKYATNRQFQITGYILELLKIKTNANIPKKIINYFYSKPKSKTKLLNNNNNSKYVSRWKLQDNLGEKEILSWWY